MDTIETSVIPTVRCYRCTMSFVVGEPKTCDAERQRCPECFRHFWSAKSSRDTVIVGIRPA